MGTKKFRHSLDNNKSKFWAGHIRKTI